jgi:hypothetical protein
MARKAPPEGDGRHHQDGGRGAADYQLQHLSDQQLACLWKLECQEAIYQQIANGRKAGGNLSLNLRINGRRRYRSRSKIGRGESIPNQVDIEKTEDRFPRSSRQSLVAGMNISKKPLFFVTTRAFRIK